MTLTFEINIRSFFSSLFLNEGMADINMSLEYQVDHKKFWERAENLEFSVMENCFHSINFIFFPFLVLLLFLDIIKQFNAISSVIIT